MFENVLKGEHECFFQSAIILGKRAKADKTIAMFSVLTINNAVLAFKNTK